MSLPNGTGGSVGLLSGRLVSAEELAQENGILRERIAQLERSVSGQLDPIMQSLLEHAPAFLTVVTPEGRLLATGRQSEAFGTVVGRSVFEFTEPSQHQVLKDALARACRTKRTVTYETVGAGENGEPSHTYMVRAFPVIADGRVTALAGSARSRSAAATDRCAG